MTTDWMTIYSLPGPVFIWFRNAVENNLKSLDTKSLVKLLRVLVLWRRELQRKIFTEISDLAEIIDFTVTSVS